MFIQTVAGQLPLLSTPFTLSTLDCVTPICNESHLSDFKFCCHSCQGFPSIQKQVDHTLDHEGLWFQADHTLDYI